MLGFRIPLNIKNCCEGLNLNLREFKDADVADQVLIGGGTFGDVFKGVVDGGRKVVIKKLKGRNNGKLFVKEANLIKSCEGCDQIIELMGAVL